jgi:3-hydroxyacyl-[acyl-carrier-protein] dehydratase
MRFRMLDRITELVPGERVVGERKLTGSEDYLADHFPLFPVMPGVLMLEAMYQAAAWLVRVTDNFEHSVVRLREARNVKYSDFVVPGQTLRVEAKIQKREGLVTSLTAQGFVHGDVAVSARLLLESVPMVDNNVPGRSSTEGWARKLMRENFAALTVDLHSGVEVNA